MPISVLEVLEDRARQSATNRSYTLLAGEGEAESLTFSELWTRARAIAARLQQLHMRNERALLLYPPGLDYISAFYGCLAAGTVAVPAYPPRMNRNLQRFEAMLEDAKPKVILATEPVFRQMRSQITESRQLAELPWIISSDVSPDEADCWIDPHIDRDTLAFLQYTSASTSRPKGVMVTHGNILHNQVLQKEAVRHGPETVMVSWLPLFHDMGLISVVLASLYNGAPCYLMSPVDFLKRPMAWLEAITRYKATFSGAPDFGYQLCVDRITPAEREQLDLSTWRVAFNGSEPVRASTLDSFASAFARCGFRSEAFYPCYGLAESTLFVSGGFYRGAKTFSRSSLEAHSPRPSQDGQLVPLVSCGRPLPDSKVRIVDAVTLCRCADGDIGEIWLSSPSVTRGYWNQPEISKGIFGARLNDDEGPFLRTGDLGFLHEGNLYVTGRLKDLIIIRGRNLVPQDIELTVEQSDPSIRPAFVAAISVEVEGAERLVVVAEVRREDRRNIESEPLAARIRGAVVKEFGVEVSAVALLRPNSLPKTSSGKTQRAIVRQEFFRGLPGVLYEWRDGSIFRAPEKAEQVSVGGTIEQTEAWLKERIRARIKLPLRPIDSNTVISAYGLDSVEAVAFGCEIDEAFGIRFDIEALFEGDPTVGQVARRIAIEKAATATQLQKPEAKNGHVRNGAHRSTAAIEPEIAASSLPETFTPAPSKKAEPLSPSAFHVSTNGAQPKRQHPFRASVNPELGRALAQMAMDKIFVRGEGSWLWDEKGRRYLDFLAQYGALPFGFNPPQIWKALQTVWDRGEPSFVQPSFLNAAGELAERLLAAAPKGMSYVTFANSGAEAVEAAIKLCRSTTGRLGILAATNGFHGKTLGALSATAKPKYQKGFGAPVEGFAYVPYGDVEALRKELSSRRYAGFLIEPVQSEGGIVEPPAGYLRAARKLCRETGTLFVADEIQTGLGRTGAMFVCGELGITPDIMVLAKALGGGLMPIGACIATGAAYNEDFALKHTSTFAGNTLACRAGIASLDLLEENDHALVGKVAENGTRLKEGLRKLKARFPHLISEVRGRGYLLGLRFGLNRYTYDQGLLGYLGEQEALTALIVSHLLNAEGVRVGYTLNQGGVLRIEPPLTATWEECSFFLHAFERVMHRIDRGDAAALTAQVTGLCSSSPETPNALTRKIVALPRFGRGRLESNHGAGRFAFLVHPLAWKDYADLDKTLSVLSEKQLAALSSAFADNFDPLVIGETRITGKNGKSAYGEFILVPRLADELKAMPRNKAVEEIREAIKLGKDRGAGIVGLGAYTSVVSQGGFLLKGDDMPPLTTGNSYTAAATRQAVRLAAAERGWSLSDCTVAVVGAGGAVGQALSILLAQEVRSLILLGNPMHPEVSRQRLQQVSGRIMRAALSSYCGELSGPIVRDVAGLGLDVCAVQKEACLAAMGEELLQRIRSIKISVDPTSMREADIVLSCTNTTERLIREEHLRPSAIVCDVARPSNVSDQVRLLRRDVTVIDGGVVRLPNDGELGFNTSLPYGHAYACMAETFMLAMEQRYCDMSLGFDLPIEPVLQLESLAGELGFQVVAHRKKPEPYGRERLGKESVIGPEMARV